MQMSKYRLSIFYPNVNDVRRWGYQTLVTVLIGGMPHIEPLQFAHPLSPMTEMRVHA